MRLLILASLCNVNAFGGTIDKNLLNCGDNDRCSLNRRNLLLESRVIWEKKLLKEEMNALYASVIVCSFSLFTIAMVIKADWKIRNMNNSPLIIAAREGNIDALMKLIRSGVNVNATNNNGETALMFAAAGGHITILEELIKAGAKINLKNNKGENALCIAIENNQKEIVDLLIKCGARVNS